MNNTKNLLVRKPNWVGLLFILWISGISTLSLVSFDFEITPGVDLSFKDKIAHFTFHCISMLLGGFAVRDRFNSSIPFERRLTFMAVGLFLYGIAIEALQAILPTGRSAELLDVLSNTMGLVMGVLLIKLLFKNRQSKIPG